MVASVEHNSPPNRRRASLTRTLRLILAIIATLFAGGRLATADTFYDFTFTGTTAVASILGGVLDVSAANQIVSVSGTANGLTAQGIPNGSFMFTPSSTIFNTYVSPADYNFAATYSGGGVFQLLPGASNSFFGSYTAVSGTSTVTRRAAGAPAPVPGGGLLSFLAFAVAGMLYGAKAQRFRLPHHVFRTARRRLAI